MITDKEKWHYITKESIRSLFRDITSTNHGGFYCVRCFHSFRTEVAFKTYEPVCDDNDYCSIVLPKEGKNALKHFHGKYSLFTIWFFNNCCK